MPFKLQVIYHRTYKATNAFHKVTLHKVTAVKSYPGVRRLKNPGPLKGRSSSKLSRRDNYFARSAFYI